MSVKFQDYYQSLGVPRDASHEDIRRAYRALARQHHPDVSKSPGSDARFKEISEAYEVLGDPQKRKKYDALGANWKAGQSLDPDGFSGFSNAGTTRSGRGFRVHVGPGTRASAGDFSDFFEQFFGGMSSDHTDPDDPAAWASRLRSASARAGRHAAPGAPAEQPDPARIKLSLPLAEAALGSTRRVSLRDDSGNTRTLDVKIPRGTTHGSLIRLAGQAPREDGTPADLLLEIDAAPDPRFSVSDRNLSTTITLSPAQAALGDKVSVPSLEGTVTLTIPPGTPSGQRLRLRGKGIPARPGSNDPPGDLFAEIRIATPRDLSPRQRDLYQQLRREETGDSATT